MHTEWALPEISESALRMRGTTLSRSEEAVVLAGAQGSSGISVVARQTRRPSGPRGGDARQDLLAATDLDVKSNDDDYAAWAAFRKAKKQKCWSRVGEKERR